MLKLGTTDFAKEQQWQNCVLRYINCQAICNYYYQCSGANNIGIRGVSLNQDFIGLATGWGFHGLAGASGP